MGILSRFGDILAANINSLLEKAEDPGKMIDQYLREAMDDLAEVKKETAGVMAEESRTKRILDENKKEIAKYEDLAKKALLEGNEADAKVFIAKKQTLENTGASMQTAFAAAHENAMKMRQLHDKLATDISQLNAKKDAIKAKVAIANTQSKINEFSGTAEKYDEVMGKFERAEEKADRMLDTANAEAELNKEPIDKAAALEAKYREGDTPSVDDELASLKKDLGL